jgi:hypothetical protein
MVMKHETNWTRDRSYQLGDGFDRSMFLWVAIGVFAFVLAIALLMTFGPAEAPVGVGLF